MTRLFLVAFDPDRRVMHVTAADYSTRAWCTAVGVTDMLEDILRPLLDYKVARKDVPCGLGMGVITPSLVARVIETKLRARYPEEAIVVEAGRVA